MRSFQTRKLFSLETSGLRLQGTYHLPDPDRRSLTGILFLSGLATPRAAHGDSAVYWAEAFAVRGYPSFRVDLPGSGDSEEGPCPEALPLINAGGHGPIVAQMIKQLAAQYGLSGVVVMGHCAGATSAMFGAGDAAECRGLVLMAPYFHLPQVLGSRARKSLIDWAVRHRGGRVLTHLFLRARELRALLRRQSLPGNANFPLLARSKKLVSSGMPILVLKAPGPKASGPQGEFDYLHYLETIAGSRSRLAVRIISGAHHTFANQSGRNKVREQVESWLALHFPVLEKVKATQEAAHERAPEQAMSHADFA